jgi:hypothetical protein
MIQATLFIVALILALGALALMWVSAPATVAAACLAVVLLVVAAWIDLRD